MSTAGQTGANCVLPVKNIIQTSEFKMMQNTKHFIELTNNNYNYKMPSIYLSVSTIAEIKSFKSAGVFI